MSAQGTESLNDQEVFWSQTYAQEYMAKNASFDRAKGVEGWQRMLAAAGPITSLLECGCNIGRNIDFLNDVLPQANKSAIELSKPAYDFVTSRFAFDRSFNGPILESDFAPASFDLVYTIGVLIHIHPDNLLANMRKMFDYSNRYVLIGEYFNRTPVMLPYHGEEDRLFKRDFGKLFLENFPVDVVSYGFLWGHEFDDAGFDDVTWWLFEKRS